MIARLAARRAATVLLLAATAWLASCGGGEVTDSRLRMLNATASYGALDLYVDDERAFTAVGGNTATTYRGYRGDTYEMAFSTPGSATFIGVADRRLDDDTDHTLVAHGREGAFRTTLITEDEDAPDSGRARVRVLNTATDAGTVDIYLVDAACTPEVLAVATPLALNAEVDKLSPFSSVLAGRYRLCVTAPGDVADLRLESEPVDFTSRGVATLVVAPTDGGVLVAAHLLRQGGTTVALANLQKRVRVVSGVTDGAPIEVEVATVDVAAGLGSPGIGDYVLVPGSTQGMFISVAGTPLLTAPLLPSEPGRDFTVLVYGTRDAPQAAVVRDDNRRPVGTNVAKVRLVHAVAGLAEPLTLRVAGAARGTAAEGTASDAVTLPSGVDLAVRVESVTAPQQRYAEDQDLVAGGIYTMFMLGSVAPGAPDPSVNVLRQFQRDR